MSQNLRKGQSDLDIDPMAALLAQHSNEPTILDQHFTKLSTKTNQKTPNSKNSPAGTKTSPPKKDQPDPVIVLGAGDDEDDDAPITLNVRQPSFSSLHGGLVLKGGEPVKDLGDLREEPVPDPVIVFENKKDETEADDGAPIALSRRQPSFVSLHGQLIPKGSDSLAELQLHIPEAINENEGTFEAPVEEPEDEEEEDDPQIRIIKHLRAKNMARWKKMGYEPPTELMPLVRAQSMAVFNKDIDNSSLSLDVNNHNSVNSSSVARFTLPITSSSNVGGPNLMEVPEEGDSTIQKPKSPSNTRKRSGSFGNKGTSVSVDQNNSGSSSSGSSYSSYDGENENEDQNEGDAGLFGHLAEIVELAPSDPVYEMMLTGNVGTFENITKVETILNKYLAKCEANDWREEADYLLELISAIKDEENIEIPENIEDKSNLIPLKPAEKPENERGVRRRSGSFGMRVGEATANANRMQQIIPENLKEEIDRNNQIQKGKSDADQTIQAYDPSQSQSDKLKKQLKSQKQKPEKIVKIEKKPKKSQKKEEEQIEEEEEEENYHHEEENEEEEEDFINDPTAQVDSDEEIEFNLNSQIEKIRKAAKIPRGHPIFELIRYGHQETLDFNESQRILLILERTAQKLKFRQQALMLSMTRSRLVGEEIGIIKTTLKAKEKKLNKILQELTLKENGAIEEINQEYLETINILDCKFEKQIKKKKMYLEEDRKIKEQFAQRLAFAKRKYALEKRKIEEKILILKEETKRKLKQLMNPTTSTSITSAQNNQPMDQKSKKDAELFVEPPKRIDRTGDLFQISQMADSLNLDQNFKALK